jgi:hypothetical protein
MPSFLKLPSGAEFDRGNASSERCERFGFHLEHHPNPLKQAGARGAQSKNVYVERLR